MTAVARPAGTSSQAQGTSDKAAKAAADVLIALPAIATLGLESAVFARRRRRSRCHGIQHGRQHGSM